MVGFSFLNDFSREFGQFSSNAPAFSQAHIWRRPRMQIETHHHTRATRRSQSGVGKILPSVCWQQNTTDSHSRWCLCLCLGSQLRLQLQFSGWT